jgi:hypothetical protein
MYVDPSKKIKKVAKFAGIFILIAGLLASAVIIFQKTRQKKVETQPAVVQKTIEEKQKDMRDTIKKANQPESQNQLPSEVQTQRQQEMTETVNKANTEAPPISAEEAAKRQQDMLNAINEQNKK